MTEKMKEIQVLTPQERKALALLPALGDFLALKRRQVFVNRVMAGETDYKATNEEIERLCAGMA